MTRISQIQDAADKELREFGEGNKNDALKELFAIIRNDHACSLLMCGGDGVGCLTYRVHFSCPERRWKKCRDCTMGTTQPMIDIVDKIEKGDTQ